jgi:hypothetical protein
MCNEIFSDYNKVKILIYLKLKLKLKAYKVIKALE